MKAQVSPARIPVDTPVTTEEIFAGHVGGKLGVAATRPIKAVLFKTFGGLDSGLTVG